MNKHTPQEWADITGCYVARDEGKSCFNIYEVKPVRNYKRNWWSNPGGDFGELPTAAVPEEYYSDDWTILYEPRLDNKSEDNYQNQPEVDNKAQPQSEVHREKEYVLLCEFHPDTLMQKVNELLKDGFKLYGNPWSDIDSDYGCNTHYQAMVRGV